MAGKGIPELLNYKQKGKDLNEFIKVPVSEKLAYCFGDPALTLMYTMTTTLLIYFYTNVVGISAGAVGMIMLLSRIFDGFSDVLMGTIIDRTHSKYGKARIWILRLAVPYALASSATSVSERIQRLISFSSLSRGVIKSKYSSRRA